MSVASLPIPDTPWQPFEPDGRWWDSALWRYNRSLVADHVPVDAAEEALRRVFPAAWVVKERERRLPSPWGGRDRVPFDSRHPFARHFQDSASPVSLIEAGWALSVLPDAEYDHRLRHPDQAEGALAELWVGLLLHQAGAADVKPEPKSNRAQKAPDWVASWNDGSRLAIECKLVDTSERSERRNTLQSWLWEAVLGYLYPRHAELFVRVSIEPAMVDRLVQRRVTSSTDLQGFASATIRRVIEIVDARQLGTTPVTGVGQVTIEPADKPLVRVDVDCDSTPDELRRVRAGALRKAAAQLAVADAPGVAVLDLTRHYFRLADHWHDIRREVDEREDMQHIGAVVLVSGACRELIPYRRIHVIPGPAAWRTSAAFLGPLSKCTCFKAHQHYEPLREPGRPHDCLLPY